jgi:hypothetical protein
MIPFCTTKTLNPFYKNEKLKARGTSQSPEKQVIHKYPLQKGSLFTQNSPLAIGGKGYNKKKGFFNDHRLNQNE